MVTEQTERKQAIEALSPWFHNLHLPSGLETAPEHWLGDFPRFKWREIESSIPQDLSGCRVLDIGCNAGFYTVELARRGAQVRAIDLDDHYLKQASWAAQEFGVKDRVRFDQMQVYDLAREEETYDLVWFMGVFYHLRYPLLGLEIAARKTKQLFAFQTLEIPGGELKEVDDNLSLGQSRRLHHPGWPKMAYIERRQEGDPANWWAANSSCVESLLRSCGMKVTRRPTDETYLCVPSGKPRDAMREREFRAAAGLISTRPENSASNVN